MVSTEAGTPAADAVVSPILDRLLLRPRPGTSPYALKRLLLGGSLISRASIEARGVAVPPFEAHRLLGALPGVSLGWDGAAVRFAENRRRFLAGYPTYRDAVKTLSAGAATVAAAALKGFRLLDALDPHQVTNVAAMTAAGGSGLCLFDEQGTGKTVSMLAAFDVLAERDEADVMLVIAPKSMIPEWKRDAERLLGDLYRVSPVTGSRDHKLQALRRGADILVTNFEATVSFEEGLGAFLGQLSGRAVLVIDESFFTKNLDAKRTRAIRRLREHCKRAFTLCGTPAPNSPFDLIEQFNIVDFGWTFDGARIPPQRAEAAHRIRELTTERGLFLRSRKHEVLTLPGHSLTRVLLDLAPVQARAYTSLRDGLVRDLKAIDDQVFRSRLGQFLARRSALLQICSHPAAVVPAYEETPAKLAALDGILADLVGRKREKVVIWSFYTATIDALERRYQHFGLVRYDGQVSDPAVRGEYVHRFQNDGSTMIFLANPAAAGAGLTLHRARFAVFESFSNQAAHYLQSMDRLHRRGQTRGVRSIVLVCRDTIEVIEYERLRSKEAGALDLLDDGRPPLASRDGLLEELLGRGRPSSTVEDDPGDAQGAFWLRSGPAN